MASADAGVELGHDAKRVTFAAVAARIGLGRTTLYRDRTIRAVIEDHRHPTAITAA